MILDDRLEFCDAVSLNTGGAGTYNLGDIIDLSVARDIGVGQDLFLVVSCDTTATSGGAATAQFQLVSDGTDTIATNGTQTIHATSRAIPVASITAGATLFVVALPLEGAVYERYLAVQQVTAVAAFTAGKINAFLTTDVSKWKAYADNVA